MSALQNERRFTWAEWQRIVRSPTRDLRYQQTTLGPHVREYLAWKRLSRAAERTLDQYERDLARLCIAVPNAHPSDVSGGDLMLLLEAIPPKSWKRYRAAWGGFFKWCARRRLITYNPLDDLPALRAENPPVYKLHSHTDLEKLVTAAIRMPAARVQRLRILTLVQTGIRAGEAIGIRLGDFDLYRKKLRVEGKGSKERLIPIDGELSRMVDEYLLTPYPSGLDPQPTDFVWFPVFRGEGYEASLHPARPLTYRAFHFWWTRLEKEARVEHRKPHMLRHTFATDVIDATGGDLYALKELLGHADIRTTELYLHSSTTRTEHAIVSLGEYRARRTENS